MSIAPVSGRRQVCAALALLGAAPAAARAAARGPDDAALEAAIGGTQRTPAYRLRDPARHPLGTLRFFGLEPTMQVIEISPGGGWYTEILAPYLRRRGRLYAAHYARDAEREYERNARARFDAKLAANPALYDRVVVGVQPSIGHGFRGIHPHGGADRVLTFRNVHNWVKAGFLDEALRAFHSVLRPGGLLGIVEHRAAPGLSIARIIDTGYVPEDFVIERARAAGFVLDARSEINANPRDTKDYPDGVWSLPPSLRGKAHDRERYLAIGESDRMTLRLRKV